MFFQITHTEAHDRDYYTWEYREGTSKAPGECFAQSYGFLTTEEAARSDIARARKAFSAARYSKVEGPK
jgi:hypothetical protein